MTRITRIIGDGTGPIDLSDPQRIGDFGTDELALALLRHAYDPSEPDDVFPRRGFIRGFVGSLPHDQRIPLGRRLAEAFQLLEHAGMVCEDAEETRPGWFFVTTTGKWLLERSSAPIDELRRRIEQHW